MHKITHFKLRHIWQLVGMSVVLPARAFKEIEAMKIPKANDNERIKLLG